MNRSLIHNPKNRSRARSSSIPWFLRSGRTASMSACHGCQIKQRGHKETEVVRSLSEHTVIWMNVLCWVVYCYLQIYRERSYAHTRIQTTSPHCHQYTIKTSVRCKRCICIISYLCACRLLKTQNNKANTYNQRESSKTSNQIPTDVHIVLRPWST